jgi:hypothetical protein
VNKWYLLLLLASPSTVANLWVITKCKACFYDAVSSSEALDAFDGFMMREH